MRCASPVIEETVRTRLGEDRLEVAFEAQPPSPFDLTRRIDRLELPLRWLSGAEVPEKVETTPTDGGFEFAVGSHKFRYDRLGCGGFNGGRPAGYNCRAAYPRVGGGTVEADKSHRSIPE